MQSYINDDTVNIPIEHMSGTLMRELIKNDKLNKFQNVMQQTGLSPIASEELFDELKYNMPVQLTKRRKVKGGKRKTYKHKNTKHKKTYNHKNTKHKNTKHKNTKHKKTYKHKKDIKRRTHYTRK
jgi:hypothetical protein